MQKAKTFSFFVIYKHTVKHMISLYMYLNYYEKIFTFFFTVYKTEWKEHQFWRQKNKKIGILQNKKLNSIDDIDVHKILVS